MGVKNSVIQSKSDYFTIENQVVKYGQPTNLNLSYSEDNSVLMIDYLLQVSILDSLVSTDSLDSFVGLDGNRFSKYRSRFEISINSAKFSCVEKAINSLIEKQESNWSIRNNKRYMSKNFKVINQILQTVNIVQKYLVIVFENYFIVLKIKKNSGKNCIILNIEMKRDKIDIEMYGWK